MKRKWYLETWFISICAFFGFLIIPLIIAVILLILQYLNDKKTTQKFSAIDDLDVKIQQLTTYYELQTNELENRKKYIIGEIEKLEQEFKSINIDCLISHYNFSNYNALSSEDCKNNLAIIRLKENELIKNNEAIIITGNNPKKVSNNYKKQLLRCFNSECDNVILNLSATNIDQMRQKLIRSYESLNKIFETSDVSLRKELLELKLEELNLLFTYEQKKIQEKEQQKAIKEQMIEEEKVRREIERQKAKLEKDQSQCSNEIQRLMKYLHKTESDIEKQLYVDKIRELEDKMKSLEQEKETILEREANARAGFVYVISNIGSFGENIYKIGMTRRLEPMDRIKELSSASVPFEFDVHAMIFSDDAPTLENNLHKYFAKQSVNKINTRKEFFKVSIDEIEKYVIENFNNTVSFTKIPQATEYRQTLELTASNFS